MKVEQKASYVFDAETFSTNSRVTELRLGIPHRVPAERGKLTIKSQMVLIL